VVRWLPAQTQIVSTVQKGLFYFIYTINYIFHWPARVYVHGNGSDERVEYRGCPATCDMAFGARERKEENSVFLFLYLSIYVTQRFEHCADGLQPLVRGATARDAAAKHTSKNQDAPGSIRHGRPPAQRPLRIRRAHRIGRRWCRWFAGRYNATGTQFRGWRCSRGRRWWGGSGRCGRRRRQHLQNCREKTARVCIDVPGGFQWQGQHRQADWCSFGAVGCRERQ
jgi:hypothetical protein